MEQLSLLVIEDRDDHLRDFYRALEKIMKDTKIEIRVRHAKYLKEAMEIIPEVNIVISDVFFPIEPGKDVTSNAEHVVRKCIALSKPVVVITSTYHHGEKTNATCKNLRDYGIEMFDSQPEQGQEEASHKPWGKAILGLMALKIGLDNGIYAIEYGNFKGEQSTDSDKKRPLLGTRLHWTVQDFIMRENPIALKMKEYGFPQT